MKRTLLLIGLLLAVLAFYLGGLLVRSAAVVRDGGLLGQLIAVGMVGLVVLGAGTVVAELRFGLATQRMGRALDEEGGLPELPAPVGRSRRPDRAAADVAFERYRLEVERSPEDWRGWYRLALAYDCAGDRKRARGAARQARRLFSAG